MGFKLNEDLFGNRPLGFDVARCPILLKEIPHLLVVGFEHCNSILGLAHLLVALCHGVVS
jgi:hypothetical protein